ncbi:MAG: endonuclease III [candidate division NC10 bacterium]|nr:endonuclease III [candidate division NC10 bacterium]MBI2116207.1 endonuclease III [candidate division NC10 bacterium]MBI3122727.1 endonuclease III [candidate division NC10 bacterium]
MRPAAKLIRIAALLGQAYGPTRPPRRRDNPLDALIHTVLSQSTSDVNSDRAYATLRQRFPEWEDVHRVPLRQLIAAIRSGGLANIKAVRIKALLEEIWADQGHFDLSFLRDLSDEEVKAYLARFKGVGSKTIACVLLFGMGRPAFPVDTHVFRVTRRLGLLNGRFTPEKAQESLEPRIPPGDRYALHVHLVRHGRQVCKAQRPLCRSCVLARVCDHVRR